MKMGKNLSCQFRQLLFYSPSFPLNLKKKNFKCVLLLVYKNVVTCAFSGKICQRKTPRCSPSAVLSRDVFVMASSIRPWMF